MIRKWLAALLALGLLASAIPAALGTRLMVATDLHYMARELYEGSDLFLRALRAGDGKLTQYGDELLAALARQAVALEPDALLVTGDLTFNGERASHEALAEWFARIEEQGVPVWVLPGNHDINVATPRAFEGDAWRYVDGVTPEEFRAIYADFLLPPEGDGANLSYLVKVGDALWVAMTDVAYYQGVAQTFGVFMAAHAQWLEGAMAAARAAGVELVTASHHNLLAHTEFLKESYVMLGGDSMAALARKYGARLHLSGHLHAQHIREEAGLTDAALGAFCAWPHRYAIVTLEDGALAYEAKALDGALLPEGFSEMSREWYLGISREKTLASLADAGLDDADAQAMADFAARFNLAYFSGTYDSGDPAWREDPGYALWRDAGDSLFWQYLKQVMDEANGDNLYRRWE